MTPEGPVMAITGTSHGIGRGLAEHFLRLGYRVAGCSRSPSTLDTEGYLHCCLDVGTESDVREWMRGVKREWRHLDALVCNAGIAPSATMLAMTSRAHLEEIVHTNITGTFYACREAAKLMMLQRSGRIVTISSITADLHEEGTSAYSASKSAVTEMTKVLAKELAPQGITCNVVAPSLIATQALSGLGSTVIENFLSKQTLKRMITVEEIGNVISFFLAPESACITGQVVHMGLVN